MEKTRSDDRSIVQIVPKSSVEIGNRAEVVGFLPYDPIQIGLISFLSSHGYTP